MTDTNARRTTTKAPPSLGIPEIGRYPSSPPEYRVL